MTLSEYDLYKIREREIRELRWQVRAAKIEGIKIGRVQILQEELDLIVSADEVLEELQFNGLNELLADLEHRAKLRHHEASQ